MRKQPYIRQTLRKCLTRSWMWEVLQDTYKMHTRKYIEKIHKVFFTKRGAMQRQVRFVHKFSGEQRRCVQLGLN